MQDRVSNIDMFCSSISLANGLVVLFSIRKRKTIKYSEQETNNWEQRITTKWLTTSETRVYNVHDYQPDIGKSLYQIRMFYDT